MVFVLPFCLLTDKEQTDEICDRQRRQIEHRRRLLFELSEDCDDENIPQKAKSRDDESDASQPIQKIVLGRREVTETCKLTSAS